MCRMCMYIQTLHNQVKRENMIISLDAERLFSDMSPSIMTFLILNILGIEEKFPYY